MPKLRVTLEEDVQVRSVYAAPGDVSGIRSSKLLSPADYRLWLAVSDLADGAEMRWESEHGDEGVYVLDGGLEVQGRHCPAGGALIVEAGLPAHARAAGPTRVAHFGCRDLPPARRGSCLHLAGPGGMSQFGAGINRSDWFADGSCETCDIMLFRVHRGPGGESAEAHSHSQDEIIYVVSGSIRLGAREYAAGASLCIPANVRYAQVAGGQGCVFLNYRAGASEYTRYAGGRPAESFREGALINGGRAVSGAERLEAAVRS